MKCNRCNIVIDELLAYIQNKLSVIDNESLVRICLSVYSSKQIAKSKSLLFESLPCDVRKIVRKGDGKEDRDLTDIISTMKYTDSEMMPVFVARNLDLLPPVTFDHLDVSKLLKDLVLVQEEIKDIKASYATTHQLEDMRKEFIDMKYSSLPPSICNVNIKRGAYSDSGPMGMSQLNETTLSDDEVQQKSQETQDFPNVKNTNKNIINENHDEGKNKKKSTVLYSHSAQQPAIQASHSGDGVTSHLSMTEPAEQVIGNVLYNGNTSKHSYSMIAAQNTITTESNETNSNEEGNWTLVQRRKLNKRFAAKSGIAFETGERFKAAEKKTPIFITNVHKDTTQTDITNYIHRKVNESVTLQKISIKRHSAHDAYKFFVPVNKVHIFLDDKLWPKGIVFRRFVHFRPNTFERTDKSSLIGDFNRDING